MPEAVENLLLGWGVVALILVAWQLLPSLGVISKLFTSTPLDVGRTFLGMIHEGSLGVDLRVSGEEYVLGYALAIVVGIGLGLATGWYRRVAAALGPSMSALYAVPAVALLPLLIIWLGIGIASKVAIVFLISVFQIIFNVDAGVRSTDQSFLTLARSFGATDRQIFTTVVLPGSIPFVITGLRLGAGLAVVGVFVGELYAATAGIGYEIAVAGETFQTGRVFVGVIIMALWSVLMMSLLRRLGQHFEAWRITQRG